MSSAPEKTPPANSAILNDAVRKDVERIEKGERERRSMLGYTVFMGTIAGLFVVPVVGGAYLGRWLDTAKAAATRCGGP